MEKLRELLKKEHSKKQTLEIVHFIDQQPNKLKTLIDIISANEPLFSQRAAWVLSVIGEQNITVLKVHIPHLINLLDKKYHDAVLRASYKCLSKLTIPEKLQGKTFDVSLHFLSQKSTPTGIKIWIIDVLMQIAKNHVELQQEISIVLTEQYKYCTVGLKGKIEKTLQKIKSNVKK